MKDEAISRRQMLSYHAFLASPHSIYSRSWTELPWRFVAWGLEQMGLRQTVSSTDTRQSRELVLIPNVEVSAYAPSLRRHSDFPESGWQNLDPSRKIQQPS